jgi:F420-dependent oxidoreductase-like protein
MLVGISTGPQHVPYPEIVRVWQVAEGLGFDSAWVFDHFMPITGDVEGPCLEALTLLSALAAQTTLPRVGTLVLGNPYRHPAVLAKAAVTLDIISNGRLELGIGAGWFETEFRAYGIPFERPSVRIRQMEEAIQVLKAMMTEHRSNFAGRYFALTDALAEPKPVQSPHPPIWVGGSGEQLTLRAVARHADGWNAILMPPDRYRAKVATLEAHCVAAGRDPKSVRRSVLAPWAVRRTREAALEAAAALPDRGNAVTDDFLERALVGSPDEVVSQIKALQAEGVEHLILICRAPYDYEGLALFAREVLPALRP